ncbi:MAG: DNRLRE domain-containing protein [Planctomycetota bacterium]|nr:DNRLRE domain-containing protein [Planctomycetota bacterium]
MRGARLTNFVLGAVASAGLVGTVDGAVVTIPVAQDATIIQENGAIANGQGLGLFVGQTGADFTRRALVRFDLSSIPAGSTINSVSFAMNLTRAQSGSYAVALHRLTAGWNEGPSHVGNDNGQGSFAQTGDVTWTHRTFGAGPLWTTPGGDFVEQASASRTIGTALTAYTWTSTPLLVADVQAWLDAPATNFGWIIRGSETQFMSARRFASGEFSSPAQRPRITIDYTPVPSPGGWGLVGAGCLLAARRRR